MKTSTVVAVVVAVVVVLGGFYWWYQDGQMPTEDSAYNSVDYSNTGTQQPGADGQEDQPAASGDGTSVGQNLIVGVSSSAALGNYLTAYNGMTLYIYTPDQATPGKSACTSTCAANWPPYTVASAADIHIAAATTGVVSTITRADGSMQVAYNGKPLYFYIKDTAVGDTKGQAVGGVWYVLKP